MQSCESDIAELRKRIDSLKHVIEQQRMRVKQGKTIGSIEMKKLTTQLAPDAVYKEALESGGTSDDKARTLIVAIKIVLKLIAGVWKYF